MSKLPAIGILASLAWPDAALTCEYDDASLSSWPSCWLQRRLSWPSFCASMPLPSPRACSPPPTASCMSTCNGCGAPTSPANCPTVPHDPDYEQFIQATGFQFERDLDEAALAIHYPAKPPGAKTDTRQQPRFSEVFVGKVDGERLRAYLRQISSSVENYRTRDIYNIPLEGRTVRVAILGVDTVAASNLDDPQVIRGIIDRSRKLASPFGGPALLRQYYKEVPFASLGWAIFKIQPARKPLRFRADRMVISIPKTGDGRGLGALPRSSPFQGAGIYRK